MDYPAKTQQIVNILAPGEEIHSSYQDNEEVVIYFREKVPFSFPRKIHRTQGDLRFPVSYIGRPLDEIKMFETLKRAS